MDTRAIQMQITELPGLIESLMTQVHQSPEEKALQIDLKDKLDRCKADHQVIEESVMAIKKDIASLHDQILNIGGIRLKAQKSRVESIVSEIESKKSANTKSSVVMKNIEKKITLSKEKCTALQNELEEIGALLNSMNGDFEKLDQDAKVAVVAMNAATDIIETKEDMLKEITHQFEEKKEEMSTFRAVEVDLQNTIDVLSKKLTGLSSKANHWKKELKSLKVLIMETGSASAECEDEDVNMVDSSLEKFSSEDLKAMNESRLRT